MPILVIAATALEIKPFLDTKPLADILITGVGVPSTIYQLQKKLQKKYSCVIQAGIAGTFNDNFHPGEVALVAKDSFGDIGIEEKESFTTLFEMNLAGEDKFPFEKGWLINPHPFLKQSALKKANAITVNKISDRPYITQQLIEKFQPDIESMEGAAMHFVCLQEQVPFLQLRAISNKVGERDKLQWCMEKAITNLNVEVKKLIEIMGNKE